MVRLVHTILLGLAAPAQVEAACEDPPGPSSQLCHPRLHPTACPEGVHVGQDERRHSASPSPSQPRTQAACSGRPGEGEEKSALVSGGVAGQECPRQGTRPSLLRPARQTEGSKGQGAVPSQLAWETSRGASTGPNSGTWRRGAGRPGGHQGVSC